MLGDGFAMISPDIKVYKLNLVKIEKFTIN